jgi:hypothetical protein
MIGDLPRFVGLGPRAIDACGDFDIEMERLAARNMSESVQ